MEFGDNWQIKFMKRTLDNLNKGAANVAVDNEVTMLVNSMLGLLVLPREKMIAELPDVAEHDLPAWGIKVGSVNCFGNQRQKRVFEGAVSKNVDLDYGPKTLKGVVHSLRNAICHFGVEPIDANGKVVAFKLRDWEKNGFIAELTNESIKDLCEQVAKYLIGRLDK